MTPTVNDKRREFQIDIGVRIQEARVAAGMTQAHLAAALGVCRPTIANIEAGRQDVLASKLVLIAQTLGVSVNFLVGQPDVFEPRMLFAAEKVVRELLDLYRHTVSLSVWDEAQEVAAAAQERCQ